MIVFIYMLQSIIYLTVITFVGFLIWVKWPYLVNVYMMRKFQIKREHYEEVQTFIESFTDEDFKLVRIQEEVKIKDKYFSTTKGEDEFNMALIFLDSINTKEEFIENFIAGSSIKDHTKEELKYIKIK